MRLGELCAGYGGLGMAVEEVFGATTAWFSEFDDAPSKILAHHWPGVPNYGDMTKIDWAAIEPVDIISGGTPCQDLSAAGKRRGMTEGTRSNLWVQMREAIAIQKPAYVVWENVRGAYSATAASDLEQCPGCMGETGDGGAVLRALGRVLGDLSDLGYDCQWRGLRAADVGACHSRFRVFVLAADRDHLGVNGAGEWAEQDRRGQPANRRHAATNTHDGLHVQGRRDLVGSAPSRERAATNDHQRPEDSSGRSATNWGDYAGAIARWEEALGRRAPSPTELSTKGTHRLSPRFTEWMMGLPDGWVTDPAIGITRNEQLKACGNGVVPQQAMAALGDMLEAFQTAEVAA
jgi:DNA (cytosine-5)-methyltransferase 1